MTVLLSPGGQDCEEGPGLPDSSGSWGNCTSCCNLPLAQVVYSVGAESVLSYLVALV